MPQIQRARLLEALIAFAICAALLLLLGPALLTLRESARRNTCGKNLIAIGTAFHRYVDVEQMLPPIARGAELGMWIPGASSDIMSRPSNVGWLVLLLPYLSGSQFDRNGASARDIQPGLTIAELCCPSDPHNSTMNLFNRIFARGNYAINAGPNKSCIRPGTPAVPCFNGARQTIGRNGEVIWYGDGVAGYNKAFRLNEFVNGLAHMVAIDEIRAGIHAADSRGVWQLAMVGSSVTHEHGLYGDDGGPNNPWLRADDVYGCDETTAHLGVQQLVAENMPCCSNCIEARQATARSMHPGGVHCLALDGSYHFIKNDIAPAIWHVMHSREYQLTIVIP